jgi:mannosyltransferase
MSSTTPWLKPRQERFLLLLLILIALSLRLYGLNSYSLNGDEYGSIAQAKQVGLNWNSILYFIFMHMWISFGESDWWLRLPSVLFGTLTVPLLYACGDKLGGKRTALACGVLAATSPFAIYHSQELRFYAFFILSTSLFIYTTMVFAESYT